MTERRRGLDRMIMASRFKAECLAILDQVEQMRISVTVTKRGRPIARVVPLDDAMRPGTLESSVKLIAEDDESYYSTGEHWDADRAR
jgi:prevent-host-death family protein